MLGILRSMNSLWLGADLMFCHLLSESKSESLGLLNQNMLCNKNESFVDLVWKFGNNQDL